ncbi:MAG: HAD-IA family hydrolase [Thermoanaerobaculia bacterium]
MPRALLLDLGNVLVRFDHTFTLRRLEAATGVPASELEPHVFGPLERDFDLGRIGTEPFFRAVEAATGLPRLADETWEAAWRDIFAPDEAALALLTRLASGVTPVLVSNTNALHWEGVLNVVPDLPRLFPLRALSFELGCAKPDPAHFAAALALARAAPDETVFGDDRAENVEAARRLGIDAFAVRNAASLAEDLARRGLLASSPSPGALPLEDEPLFRAGLVEFRAARFFEAHEEWEALWMRSEGKVKLFLQALIQLAAACVHLTRGSAGPGVRLLTLADEKLARFGDRYAGVSVDLLRRGIVQAQMRIARGEAPGEAAKAPHL